MKDIKDNLNIVFNEINHFLNKVVFKVSFYFPFLITVFISYGFNLFNRTVSIDDMAQEIYYGSGNLKIKGLRWGQWLINRIFSTIKYTPFLNRLLGIIFLTLTVIFLGTLFSKLTKKEQPTMVYTVFACIFVSYPLINEFWEYYESLTIPFMFALSSFCVLYEYLNKTDIKDVIFIGALMPIAMSGYESLVFAYVTLVFVILYYEFVINENKKGWIKEGFRYAIPLFVALLLKFIVGYLLLFIFKENYATDGDSGLSWFNKGFHTALLQVVFNGWYYVIRGLSYLPIGEFVLSYLIYFIYIIKNQINGKKNSLIIGLLLMLSLFFLPVLQGSNFGYRTAQTVHLFVAYVIFILLTEKDYKPLVKKILIGLLLLLSFRQAISLHYYLALNNQRSDNEAALIQNIGFELYNKYDLEKNVVFVGSIDLGEFIDSDIYVDADSLAGKLENALRSKFGFNGEEYNIPIVSTDVSSEINWMISSNWQEVIKNYLAYYGYDINVDENLTSEQQEEYYKLAKTQELKPGEIIETDDYIIVYVGN